MTGRFLLLSAVALLLPVAAAAAAGARVSSEEETAKAVVDALLAKERAGEARSASGPVAVGAPTGEEVQGIRGLQLEASEAEAAEGAAEHGDAEDHGHEHKHAEGHVHVAKVTLTIAVLLFIFLFCDLFLIIMVNYPDANVRSYMYKMISATLSIFCAVLLNSAIFSFVIDQIVCGGREGMGVGLALDLGDDESRSYWHAFIGLILLISHFVSVNAMCYAFREDPQTLYAVQIIGGHLMAFAGIVTFGHLQVAPTTRMDHGWWTVTVLVGAALFIALARLTSKLLRGWCCGEVSSLLWHPSYEPLAHEALLLEMKTREELKEENEWREAIKEAEADASAIIMSFLTLQSVLYFITGRMSPVEQGAAQHSATEALNLALVCAMFLLLLVCLTFLMREAGEEVNNSWRVMHMRVTTFMQTFLAMSTSWCTLRLGFWLVKSVVRDMELAHVVTAFSMTMTSIAMIILLDFCADTANDDEGLLQAVGPQSATVAGPAGVPPAPSARAGASAGRERGAGQGRLGFFDRTAYIGNALQHRVTRIESSSKVVTNLDRALRTVISATGLLVGSSAEKAFHAAVHGTPLPARHRVILKFLLALLNVVLVLHVWRAYIFPQARRHWTDHQALRKLQNQGSKS